MKKSTPQKEEHVVENDSVEGIASVQACHDLHVVMLISLNKEDEAKELYKMFKEDGSKKPPTFKEFVKRTKLDDIGRVLIDSWLPNSNELK